MQSVAHGGIAEAEASHWVGPGATVQGASVVVGVGVVVGTGVVLASVADVSVGGPVVGDVGAPVHRGVGT